MNKYITILTKWAFILFQNAEELTEVFNPCSVLPTGGTPPAGEEAGRQGASETKWRPGKIPKSLSTAHKA